MRTLKRLAEVKAAVTQADMPGEWTEQVTEQATGQLSQLRDAQPVVVNAVVLLREAGLSQRQIAETLGCSRSKVRRQLALCV